MIREASKLSQRNGSLVSSSIENKIKASNYSDLDARHNDVMVSIAYPVPTAPPLRPETIPAPSYSYNVPSFLSAEGEGYTMKEYRSIYDVPNSSSSAVSSDGGYKIQEYKSIYDK